MNKTGIYWILTLAIYLSCFSPAIAQKTMIYESEVQEYNTALELFDKEKFGAARKAFRNVVEHVGDPQSEYVINAQFYIAVSALNLFHEDAEFLLMEFINNYPENHNVKSAHFYLGKYSFRKKNYYSAIDAFRKLDVLDLDEEERNEYYFKLGYCYFITRSYKEASKVFYELKDDNNEYAIPAIYYYGHCAYMEKQYETALQNFQKIKEDESFGPIVPYYITQIYYLQENYDKLLEVAPDLYKEANTKRSAEIARLIGNTYYNTKQYDKALPYLGAYIKDTKKKVLKTDIYQLAYTYFKNGYYKKSKNYFEKAISEKYDSLSQNCYYHIGHCYLQLGNKNFARNSFMLANLPYDKEIQKDALFNYAKLSYELGYNPYNETINAFEKYLQYYPNCSRIDEVNTYLSDLYVSTRNYKSALRSIESIKNKGPKLNSAYQKVAFFRAVEMFNNSEIEGCISVFDKSLKNNYDASVFARSHFWKAESYYRLALYDSAITNYNVFLYTPGAFSLSNYKNAHYNLGYSYFNQKNYTSALTSFRKYADSYSEKDSNVLKDTYLRIGDCFFVTKAYKRSVQYYDKAVAIEGIDSDYALFQKSLALGVIGKYEAKVDVLLEMLRIAPESAYADDAKYELAGICVALNDNEKALRYYQKVLDEYPTSSYRPKAMLRIGAIQYDLQEDEKALVSFQKVLDEFPASVHAKEALSHLKRIHVEMDKAQEYLEYVKQFPFAELSVAEKDSITYSAIENKYMEGDCEESVKRFEEYLENFADGYFALNASFYKSECEFEAGAFEKALIGYYYVISKPRSEFTETSILRAAGINYILGNFESALEYYTMLEKTAEYKSNIITARTGVLRSQYSMKKHEEVLAAGRKLLETEKISPELKQEAHYMAGLAAMETDSVDLAINEFVVTDSLLLNEISAKAKYNMALIYFNQKRHEESESMIFKLINQVPSYDYWVAKGFILLADNYMVTENLFQAKHTLQSIVDNYDGDEDLVDFAKKKIQEINEYQLQEDLKEEEKRMKENPQEPQLEIEIVEPLINDTLK